MKKANKVSLIIGSFKRANLLKLSLWSIARQKIGYDLEIVVLNDGIKDETEKVCEEYSNKLNIKYFFTGQRNTEDKMIPRNSGFAMNIGVKQCEGNIIILSGSEIFHLNNGLNAIIEPLILKKEEQILSIPRMMYIDDIGKVTNILLKNPTVDLHYSLIDEIRKNLEYKRAVLMPFCMGLYKKDFMDIGGYDEDFVGYAGDDNDLVYRLNLKGFVHYRTYSKIIHLYHGKRCDSRHHWSDSAWVYNYLLFRVRRDKIIRNENKEWGKI